MGVIFDQQDYRNPLSLSARFRTARTRYIKSMIADVFAARGACRIIDLGGRPEYWELVGLDFLTDHKVTITTINLEPQPPVESPLFDQRTGDACATGFEDMAFDIAHSNSVIEHVGDWENVERFAAETRRLAPKYYAQTPYFWFPYEPHFSSIGFHWLPESLRARALMRRRHGFQEKTADMGEAMRSVRHARLLDRRMMAYLFPDADLVPERVLGLTKSLMAIRGQRQA